MRVQREQIVKGVADYLENDVIPQMKDDKAMQILLDFAVNMIKTNTKLADLIFDDTTVKMMFRCNEDGTYEI